MSKKRLISALFSILIPLLCGAVVLFKPLIFRVANSDTYPECPFYATTGWLCPGCGNTRAVLALLDGHLLQSIGYNPMIVILSGVLLGFYVELVCFAFGKTVHIIPRSYVFLYVTLGFVLTYFAARNFFPWMTLSFG